MRRITTAVVVVAALLGGCGEPDLDLATEGLLAAGDFPDAWSMPENGPEDEGPSVGGFSGSSADEAPAECRQVTSLSEAGAVADGASGTLVSGHPAEGSAALANNFIWVYRDPAVAEKTLAAWRSADDVTPCLEVFMATALDGMILDPVVRAAVGAYDISVEPLEPGGGAQVAWQGRLSLQPIPEVQEVVGERLEFVGDFVVARVDRAVTLLIFVGFGAPVDTAVRDGAVAAVVGRLSGA